MVKGDKYKKLFQYLKGRNSGEVRLTFEQIETLLGFKLPPSAYNHAEAWWSNNYDHSQAIAWMDAGYYTDYVTDTYLKKEIIFRRN
ncbi:DUF7662 domain-containing protein [Lysinibacillus sp. C5.1]|uniref:DUF7662 domain-containing protein n=1 Tax=Lysinibacillus sp. C5.1 TaxID=2796169 RepID=UPI003081D646